ncbi:enoyl-CoA hydratase [Paracoccus aurantiacus]|uniref:Enoyl-CoA hydratase n=1 Tax=Paracoccus aurantiacus TaxID=2599412 RepID=A0A5C6RNT9_9RHOB|nr:enoyl-CoA hydratase-related protein [Paracoccus aurantiacus]TXB63644.1 enoyl-CoA hydratase [Paracoccus aurantiacus]
MRETASNLVLVERRGSTLLLTLNRPHHRNGLCPQMCDGLQNGLELAQAEASVANVVIQGAEGFFSAGEDIEQLGAYAALSAAQRISQIEALHDTIRAVRTCRKPVIASVEGGAAGAAASVALAADMIVAATDASFGMSHVKLGLVPDGGATSVLARALPPQKVAEILLLGEPVSALRLAQFGIVNRISATGGALSVALRLADELAAGALDAQAMILSMLDGASDRSFDEQMDIERQHLAQAFGGAEAAEGIAACNAGRKPDFGQPTDAKRDKG